MIKIYIFLLMFFCLGVSYAGDLKPFISDGCSVFPDGTESQKKLWYQCCFFHDKAYWQGGSYSERENADLELHSCVANVGEPEIAAIMLAGARVGGTPYFPTEFRWGYGWPYFRGYKALTEAEQKEVQARLKEYNAKNIKSTNIK